MRTWLLSLVIVCVPIAHADDLPQPIDVLLVVGAEGEKPFGEAFATWADAWKTTCTRAGLSIRTIGPGGASPTANEPSLTDRKWLESSLAECGNSASDRPLWLILIGHGTWDGTSADFNLVGPDVNAKDIHDWLGPIQRPVVIACCTSSSGPFINQLSGPNRVIVTATKSGSEHNFARFGEYFANAFGTLQADLDHDDSISVREAFLKATNDVERFYREQGRLATEHALLDDNQDRKGSSAALLLGKARSKGGEKIDGDLANRLTIPATTAKVELNDEQRRRRDELESQLSTLQFQHSADQNQHALRQNALPILIKLAKLYADMQPPDAESRQSDQKAEHAEDPAESGQVNP